MIWFNKDLQLSDVQQVGPDTMATYLEMEWTEVGPDYLCMRMPVVSKTKQPYGLLHGGASCALAETIGSVASYLCIDYEKYLCVGMEINANHLKGVPEGYVTATCRPLHLGRSSHVWDIRIHQEDGALVCVSRLTVAVIPKDR
ncbi:MAG TPA: hotdog fold thioesterase [Ferruginibacter sp.]|nr:hotdog fold thioesterase [Ferruginibacter sp.]HRO05799.1 hotdog fold thioesterase [Ferruginibacter sp.]HRO95907.1 hotdog fold thioesterase [Ferruginibacter sp.]HRP48756.1 hotdog fold thioesterase [Ferruginibacter sp.]